MELRIYSVMNKLPEWIERLELLFTGMDINDNGEKRALLLHYAGERVYDIYNAENGESPTSHVGTKQILSTYFYSRKNVQVAVYKLRNCKQSVTQTLSEYVAELRKLSKDCEFEASPAGLGGLRKSFVKCTRVALQPEKREALAIVWACEHFDMYLRGTFSSFHRP